MDSDGCVVHVLFSGGGGLLRGWGGGLLDAFGDFGGVTGFLWSKLCSCWIVLSSLGFFSF